MVYLKEAFIYEILKKKTIGLFIDNSIIPLFYNIDNRHFEVYNSKNLTNERKKCTMKNYNRFVDYAICFLL